MVGEADKTSGWEGSYVTIIAILRLHTSDILVSLIKMEPEYVSLKLCSICVVENNGHFEKSGRKISQVRICNRDCDYTDQYDCNYPQSHSQANVIYVIN